MKAIPVTHEAGPYTHSETGDVVYMAKFITSAKPDEVVIYLNGDPLDNQRENLKVMSLDEFRRLYCD